MFEPQLFSFHATCLHRRLTEFLQNCVSLYKANRILTESHVSSSHTTDLILTESPLTALSCLLYHKCQQSDDFTCMRMSSRNIYKCKQVVYCVLCICLRSSLLSCCCLFICLYAILYCTLLLLISLSCYFFFFF